MSLFVGNISRNVRMQQLEDAFEKYGRCSIRQNRSFAFIEYDDERSAEDAQRALQGQDMGGLRIGIEWSKRSRRYDAKSSLRPHARDRDDDKCYNCNRTGHYARDCRSHRRERRSRSRSPRDKEDRRRHSRSRSRSPRGERRGRDRRSRSPRGERRGRDRRDRRSSRDRDARSRSRDDSRDGKRDNFDKERSPAAGRDREDRGSMSPRGNTQDDRNNHKQRDEREERDAYMEGKPSQEPEQRSQTQQADVTPAVQEERQHESYVDESNNGNNAAGNQQANGAGDEKHDAAAEGDEGARRD